MGDPERSRVQTDRALAEFSVVSDVLRGSSLAGAVAKLPGGGVHLAGGHHVRSLEVEQK